MRQQDPKRSDPVELAGRRVQIQEQERANREAEEATERAAAAMREKTDGERSREVRALQQRRNAEAEDVERRRQLMRVHPARRFGGARPPAFDPPQAPPDKRLGSADLDAMSVGALAALAASKGIEVPRGDGKPGRPTKADYVAALTS